MKPTRRVRLVSWVGLVAMLACLLLAGNPPTHAQGEEVPTEAPAVEAPLEPTAGDLPAQEPEPTEPAPPQPTEAPAPTDVPAATDPPAPTDVPTEIPPVTGSPTDIVDAPPEQPTDEPGGDMPMARMALAPAAAGMLTVNGQTGIAFANQSEPQVFSVGDILDMASKVPDFIMDSNPDPDFYNFNGWWTSNSFHVFGSANCTGPYVEYGYDSHFLPTDSVATYTFSGPPGSYSVRASQWLMVWWLERRIDIVDAVDEVIVYPEIARSNCVTVNVGFDHVQLLANGSTGPVTVNEGDPIGLVTSQPTLGGYAQQLDEADSSCRPRDLLDISAPDTVTTVTLTGRPPGTYWFIARSLMAGEPVFTNCVQVTVTGVPASLSVEGGTTPVTFITGQAVSMYAQGFTPGSWLTGLAWPGSHSCAGVPFAIASGLADGSGALESGATLNYGYDLSVRFVTQGVDGNILESTNCVTLLRQATQISLTVNGSIGPVLVEGDEIHLVATGLPPGSVAHAVIGCTGPFQPDDFGQVIGADGIYEGFMSDDLPVEFGIRVALDPPSTVSSNCVSVRLIGYQVDPRLTIDGSEGPVTLTSGQPFTLGGTAFPPFDTVTIERFAGSLTCDGEPVPGSAFTDTDGEFSSPLVAGSPGIVSYRGVTGSYTSNCVAATVEAAPPASETPETETPEPPETVTPQEFALLANDSRGPVTVDTGTRIAMSVTGLAATDPYTLSWFPDTSCGGTSSRLVSGQAGSGRLVDLNRTTASAMSVALTSGERVSNCVELRWVGAPVGTVTPSPTDEPPETVVPTDDSPETAVPTDPASETPVPTDSPAGGVSPTATVDTGAPIVTNPGSTGGTVGVTGLPVTGASPGTGGATMLLVLMLAGAAFLLAALAQRRRGRA